MKLTKWNKKPIFNSLRHFGNIFLFVLINVLAVPSLLAQNTEDTQNSSPEIHSLIEKYNQAREKKDPALIEQVLTTDVDQLVSSGEWRRGLENAIEGMLRSSNRNPGQRTLTVERIRFLGKEVAIVDTRYEIKLSDTVRNLWSTFIVIRQEGHWKIAAIRNMSPTKQP